MKRRAIITGVAACALLGGVWALQPRGAEHRDVMAAGRAAVDAPMKDLEGRTRTLQDWAGQTRLVNFWATWCAPCRSEIPLFQSAYERFGSGNFQIIGAALDRPDAVAGFKSSFGIAYPLLIIGVQSGTELMHEFGNASGAIPYSVLLSPDSEVLATQLGPFSETQLDELLERHLDDQAQGAQMTRRPVDP